MRRLGRGVLGRIRIRGEMSSMLVCRSAKGRMYDEDGDGEKIVCVFAGRTVCCDVWNVML
jgi:hypothetical protein